MLIHTYILDYKVSSLMAVLLAPFVLVAIADDAVKQEAVEMGPMNEMLVSGVCEVPMKH